MARAVLRLWHKTLVTALAHLHVRNLARRFDWIRFAASENFASDGCS
jgi:hypothetical protein